MDKVARLSRSALERLRSMKPMGVREARGLGYLLGLECEESAQVLQQRLLEEQVMVGTSGHANTIRLLPPLTSSEGEWECSSRRSRRLCAADLRFCSLQVALERQR